MRPYRVTASFVLILLALFTGSLQAGGISEIERAHDMAKASDEARTTGVPVAVLFVSRYCLYCERLKAEYLLPKLKNGGLEKRIVIRELDINNYRKVTDFDGERTRSRIITRRYDISATPTLVFLDYRGKELTRPIVGYSLESYQSRVERALEDSNAALARHGLTDRNRVVSRL